MAIGQLVVRLGLDAADYVQGMTKAEAQAQRFGESVGKSIKRAADLYTVTSAISFLKDAFVALNNQVESIAAFQNLSEKIGDTAENLASLKKASDVSGVSMDSIAAASIKLTAALSKTDEDGKGAAQAIKALGLDFESFKKLSPVEQIEAVSKAMAGFEDGAGKTAVAVALWGKSGADMIPLLNDLASGSERQITLTNEQIKAADDFSKSMARLKSEASTLLNQGLAPLLPVFTDIIKAFDDAGKASDTAGGKLGAFGGTSSSIQNSIKDTTAAITDLVGAMSKAKTFTVGLFSAVKNFVTGDLDAADKAVSDTAKALRDKNKIYTDLYKAISAAGTSTKDPRILGDAGDIASQGNGGDKPALSFGGKAPPKTSTSTAPKVSDADRYLKSLENQIEATKKLTVEETLLSAIRKGDLGIITPAMQAQLLLRAQELDAIKARGVEEAKNAEQNKKDSESALAMLMRGRDEYNKRMEEGQRLTNSVKTEQERVNELTEYYNSLMSDPNPIITLETYNRLMAQLKGKTDENNTSFINFQATAAQAANSLADGLTDAIMQGKSLGDVFKNVVKQLAAMVLKALIFKAIGFVMDKVVPGSSSLLSGAKAGGGSVNQNSSYLVGERGPELFTPSQSGKITTNAQTFKSANDGKMTASNVYNISAPGVSREEFMSGLNRTQAGAVSTVRENKTRRRA